MESRDEETLELKETYSSLQQEVDIKTKKLKKVKRKRSCVEGQEQHELVCGRREPGRVMALALVVCSSSFPSCKR